MKVRIVIACLFVTLLLASSIALAQSGRGSSTSSYVAQNATLSAGHYRLTSQAYSGTQNQTWQGMSTSADGKYLLARSMPPELNGSGCCCMYLPCTMK
jgi:hypothetical protein